MLSLAAGLCTTCCRLRSSRRSACREARQPWPSALSSCEEPWAECTRISPDCRLRPRCSNLGKKCPGFQSTRANEALIISCILFALIPVESDLAQVTPHTSRPPLPTLPPRQILVVRQRPHRMSEGREGRADVVAEAEPESSKKSVSVWAFTWSSQFYHSARNCLCSPRIRSGPTTGTGTSGR